MRAGSQRKRSLIRIRSWPNGRGGRALYRKSSAVKKAGVLGDREAVGHAGDIVGDRAGEIACPPLRPIRAAWPTGRRNRPETGAARSHPPDRGPADSGCRYMRASRNALMSRSAAANAPNVRSASAPPRRPPRGSRPSLGDRRRLSSMPSSMNRVMMRRVSSWIARACLEPRMEIVDLPHQSVEKGTAARISASANRPARKPSSMSWAS